MDEAAIETKPDQQMLQGRRGAISRQNEHECAPRLPPRWSELRLQLRRHGWCEINADAAFLVDLSFLRRDVREDPSDSIAVIITEDLAPALDESAD